MKVLAYEVRMLMTDKLQLRMAPAGGAPAFRREIYRELGISSIPMKRRKTQAALGAAL